MGSSMMMSSAPRASARRISTFCWSAAVSAPTAHVARHVEAGVLASAAKRLPGAPAVDDAGAARLLDAQEDVLGTDDARGTSGELLGDGGDAVLEGGARRAETHRAAPQDELAARRAR